MNWSESTDWVPSGWVSHNHSHRGDETEAESTLSSEHRDEWETKWEERQLKFGVCVKWAEVGFLILISNDEFCTFFFFFFFWISSWIGGFGDFGRYGPSWPNLAQIGPSRSRVGASRLKKKKKTTWPNTAGCVGSGVPRVLSCPATSDAGATPLVSRPCFTGNKFCWLVAIYATITM